MPSRDVYEKCLKAGYRVDKIAYEKYDSLASENDLELLFDVLSSFKDKMNKHPVLTANIIVANPDFEKIKKDNFREYHYELVTETFKKYPEHSNNLNLWMDGLKNGLFFPQSHGREHLNVSEFMSDLKNHDKDLIFAVNHGMPGIIPYGNANRKGNSYVEALRYHSCDDKFEKLKIVLDGLNHFEEIFGYCSESFIPNNYFWSPDFDKYISQHGVKYYQGNRKMREIQLDGSKKFHTHYLGKKNKNGQYYLVRNAVFEPSLHKLKIKDPVSKCISDISAAFIMKKPAIICSHRVNYVGYIDKTNRDKNLKLLEELLKQILKKWNYVEFMNSVELGHLIGSKRK